MTAFEQGQQALAEEIWRVFQAYPLEGGSVNAWRRVEAVLDIIEPHLSASPFQHPPMCPPHVAARW